MQRAREQARMIHRLRHRAGGSRRRCSWWPWPRRRLAVHQGRVADRRAAEANRAETEAVARAAGSAALVTDDVDESLLLAVAGVRLDDSVDSRRSLLAAIGRLPAALLVDAAARRRPGAHSSTSAPSGGLVATMDFRQRVRVYDGRLAASSLAERQVGAPTPCRPSGTSCWQFSPDGRTLAVAAIRRARPAGAPARRPHAASAVTIELRTPREPGWIGTDLAFSQDGHHLAAAVRRSGSTRGARGSWWGRRRPRWCGTCARCGAAERVRLPDLDWQSVALSPDGSRLYTSRPLVEHDLVHGGHRVLDPRPTGSLAIGRDGRRARRPAGRAGRSPRPAAPARSPAWTPTLDVGRPSLRPGRQDAAAGRRGTTGASEIWRIDGRAAATGGERGPRSRCHRRRGLRAPTRSFLYSASGSSALRRWDLTGQREFVRRDAVAGERRRRRPSPWWRPTAAREVFIPGDGDGFAVHDLETGDVSRVMRWGEGYRHTIGAWHPDGRHYATAVGDRLRGLGPADRHARGRRPCCPVAGSTEIDYTPDGSRLVVAELGGRISMLSTRTWTPVGQPGRRRAARLLGAGRPRRPDGRGRSPADLEHRATCGSPPGRAGPWSTWRTARSLARGSARHGVRHLARATPRRAVRRGGRRQHRRATWTRRAPTASSRSSTFARGPWCDRRSSPTRAWPSSWPTPRTAPGSSPPASTARWRCGTRARGRCWAGSPSRVVPTPAWRSRPTAGRPGSWSGGRDGSGPGRWTSTARWPTRAGPPAGTSPARSGATTSATGRTSASATA